MAQAHRLTLPSAPAKTQVKSRDDWNNRRSLETADFFTIGYSGRSTEEILSVLLRNNIGTLVDIRQNPVSMYRPEVSKRNLAEFLKKNGIYYTHLPELGVPRDIRAKAIETGSRDVIWKWYDDYVLSVFFGKNLHFFFNAFEHPIALMCTEIDPQECHRHRISLALEHMGMRGFDL